MDVGRPSRDSALAAQWQEEQRVALDLTRPLDRERAGLGDGRRGLALERTPPGDLDVALQLPGDRGLGVPAVSLAIDTGSTDQPEYLSVVQLTPLEPGLVRLSGFVADFGFDRTALQAFVEQVETGSGDVARSLGEVQLGYLRYALEARLERASGELQLNHVFRWEPA